MKSFGEFLRFTRKNKGLSQEQVAKELHVVPPVLSKWENDKGVPSLSVLCKLCNVLEISLEDCIANEKTASQVLPPIEYDPLKLGNTLKELRIKNGWSQTETGQKLFVTSQTISKWENGGVVSLETLNQFSDLYGVTTTNLLNGLKCELKGQTSPNKPKTITPSEETPQNIQQETKEPQTAAEKPSKKTKGVIAIVAAILGICLIGLGVALILKSSCKAPQVPKLCMPLESGYVYRTHDESFKNSSGFYLLHKGVDIKAEEGTTVYAVADGTIALDEVGQDGTRIELTSGDYTFVYLGITPLSEIQEGATVKKGDIIAKLSASYQIELNDGPHLHFEMLLNGKRIDPLPYLSYETKPLPTQDSGNKKPEKPKPNDSSDQSGNTGSTGDVGDTPDPTPITSEYINPLGNILAVNGYNEHCLSGANPHTGVDLVSEEGERVLAVLDGTIKRIIVDDAGVGTVVIEHADGCESRYTNLQLDDWVSEGADVQKGQTIGFLVSVSDESCYLHFELHSGMRILNPEEYFDFTNNQQT